MVRFAATCVLALACVLAPATPGWSDHDDSGCSPHPSNDDYTNAAELPFVPFATAGTTLCATPEPGEPDAWCEDADPSWMKASVWYRFRPTRTERVTVHVLGAGIPSYPPILILRLLGTGFIPFVVHVYEGDSFGGKKYACHAGLEPLNLSQASFLAVERKTYLIQVSPAEIEGPRAEGGGDFALWVTRRVETDPDEILP